MPKKKLDPLIIGIILVLAIVLFKGQDEMSFYQNRECFVSETQMGCEALYGAETINLNDNCVEFMESKGCQPENCMYYGDAVCGKEYSENDMVRQECTTTQECIDRFQNTGYWCYNDDPANDVGFCKFEGNHWPEGKAVKTFAFGDFSFNEWVEKNSAIFVILGAIVLIWLLIFIFTEERPKFILK